MSPVENDEMLNEVLPSFSVLSDRAIENPRSWACEQQGAASLPLFSRRVEADGGRAGVEVTTEPSRSWERQRGRRKR